MIRTVEDYIKKFNMISPGDEIVAGVSGGADSVCMLLLLLEYSKNCEIDLKVVHINHLIREDASSDADFVKRLCDEHGIRFFLFEEDVEGVAKVLGLSTEEAGRKIRYERFRQVMTTDRAKIAVAHNKNDVAETVLFNIFRGTGLEGLSSLMPVNGDIIRPLLGLSREEIEDYLKEKGQSYRTDSTNLTNDYARNRIRNVILPYVEENITTGSVKHIAQMSEKMFLLRDYVKEQTDAAYDSLVTVFEDESDIDVPGFLKLHEMLQRELLLRVLEKMTPYRKDITSRHVESILTLVEKTGEKRADLPYDLEAVRQYDRLIIRKKKEIRGSSYSFDPDFTNAVCLPDKSMVSFKIFERPVDCEFPKKTYTKWFDYDKIINCVKLRTRQTGDYLTINAQSDKKSLNDYLIDSKIPKEKRDDIPIIADGSHVLWAVGLRISEYYKITDNTKTILEISVDPK